MVAVDFSIEFSSWCGTDGTNTTCSVGRGKELHIIFLMIILKYVVPM